MQRKSKIDNSFYTPGIIDFLQAFNSMLGNFSCRLLTVFKINFFKKIFQYDYQSNSLDPDQDRHLVGPDLGPNCLQRLTADDKIRRQS